MKRDENLRIKKGKHEKGEGILGRSDGEGN